MDIVFLVVLFAIAWLIVKSCLFILSIKFKLNINFNFNRNHLKNVSISKSSSSSESIKKSDYDMKIGKIWISSCYVNRNVNERLLICSSDISIKMDNSLNKSSPNRFKIPWFVSVYLNFFGSLNLENIELEMPGEQITIKQIKLEKKSHKFIRVILEDLDFKLDHNELVGNKFVVTLSPDFQSFEFESDKINLNFNIMNYLSDLDKLKSQNSDSKWFKSIKSIIINKLTLNKRQVFNRLEIYSTNLDYLKINLNCLNDLMLSKNTRLVDNLLIEVFNTESTYDLVFKCDQSNIYFYLDELEYALNRLKQVAQIENGHKFSKTFRLEFKLNNCYVSLIDRIQNDIYVLGSLLIDLNTNLKNLIKFESKNFVLFKSSQKPVDKYSNNLFSQSSDLVKLFQWINYKKFSYPGPRRQYEHVWGNIVNCNFVKFRFKLTTSKRKIVNIFADQLFIEHSRELFDHIVSCVSKWSLSNETKRESIFNLRLNQTNLIHIFEKKYFLHFSLEELSLKKHGQLDAFTKSFCCFHSRLTKLSQNESQYLMNQNTINHQKENEKTDLIFLLKSIKMNRKDRHYSISMDDALVTWSLKSHFSLNEIFFKPIGKYLSMFDLSSNQSASSVFSLKIFVETNILVNFLFDYSQDSSKKSSSKDQNSANYRYFNSNIKLIDTLSFTLTKFYYFYTKKNFNLNISEICSFVNTYDLMILYTNISEESNSQKFLQAKKISIYTDEQSDCLVEQRQNIKTKIEKNKLLFAKFELIHVIFLFQYDFAKVIDHVLNLRKVLYKIHQVAAKKIEMNPDGAISMDFALSVKQIKLVIEDDPFEVKLSYNYSLIADEHMESLKRRQSLDQRRSIRENNLESQALEILLERESKIYIQRSKMVYSTLPRKELFCICIENLDLSALSDSEWHGRQKCYEILRKIDHVSPPPPKLDHNTDNFEPALNYLILWCRHIDLNVQDLKFLFRDYTQPFLKINGANFFGKFLGSEYQVAFKSRRQVKICVSSELSHLDYCVFEIERYMSPIKFYHDLSSKMAVLHYAYGPCWEGCMAQLNLSLEKIFHPARDPSKPLPWWDKSRLYLHGRLTACVQQCHIIYHVSMDPYNRTEEMKLVWTRLNFDWKNMQLSFDGTLDIFLNTESKYDDCLLLHLPNLNAKINIEWICKTNMFNKSNEPKTNSNGHNLVVLHAPDKLPLIVNSFEHDSYSQFRSEGLNLFFSFQCRQCDIVSNVPTCKFYASTSRFLQKIKNLLSAITRPTKRGNLFGNMRPKKTILSRHFKRVNFKFDMARINVIYWSSASEQYGIQLESEDYFMNSSFKLDLVPFADKLKRRHKPNWSIELMKFSVKQTNVSLMSPGNANSEKTSSQSETDPFMLEMNERSIKFLDSKPAVKNFFMKIDSIAYEREKSCQYNFYPRGGNESANETLTSMSMSSLVPIQVTNCPKHNLSIRNLKAKWNTVNRDVVYILFEIYNKSNRLRQNLSAHILKQYDLFTDQLLQNHILSQYKNQQKMSTKSSEANNGKASVRNKVGPSGENQFEELLKKLDNEKKLNSNVFCSDMPLNQSNWHFDNLIYGFHSTNRMGDILSENVTIQLINSQIKLNLDESWQSDESLLSFIPKPKRSSSAEKQQEYVIISAARANVVQHLHKPVWKSQRCLEKISWSGHLENMQYFATLNNKDTDSEYWLSQELIDPVKDLPQNFLIEHGGQAKETRLQLIVPKCHCEFYLIGFYDQMMPDDSLYIQNTASTFNLSNLLYPNVKAAENCHQYLLDLNPSFNEPIDCFTLIHHDVSLACNSAQYKLFMDLVNNLVLYFRPRRKQIIERQKAIKFNLELSMGKLDSLKNYIQRKQIETKNLLCNLRSLEKQIFYLKENIENEINQYNLKFGHLQTPQGQFYVIQELKLENKNLEKQYKECKKFLNELSDELNVLISCYKEMMVEKRAFNLAQTPMFVQYVMENEKQSNNPWLLLPSSNKFSDLIDLDQLAQKSILNSEIPKRYEIWFKNTKWKLNDDHGQNGLAKFLMKNFLYTKVMNQQELDCVEHNLEIESCKLQDLDPGMGKNKVGKVYQDVLSSLFEFSQADGSCGFSDQNLSNSTSASTSVSDSISSSMSSLSFNENSLNTIQNSTMVRIYCKERPPVGIPVIEHLELNVSPLKINLTNRFFKTMIKYFFENEISNPNNAVKGINNEDSENFQNSLNCSPNNQNMNHLRLNINGGAENNLLSKAPSPAGLKNILGHHKRPSQSSLKGNNIKISSPNIIISSSNNSMNPNKNKNQDTNSNIHLHDDDVEIMKQRSANNNTFLCIKIPEIQLLVTYKGSCIDKKNIKDLKNVSLLFPIFEVHDKTWTWFDLINALKSHVKKALLSQAIKHKLIKIPIQPVNKLINRNRRSNSQQQLTDSQIEENEKITFLKLFGTKFIEKKSVSSTPSNVNHKTSEINTKTNQEQTSPISTKKKNFVSKSKSSIGFGLRKHFSKLNKEKVEPRPKSSNLSILSMSDNILNNGLSENDS